MAVFYKYQYTNKRKNIQYTPGVLETSLKINNITIVLIFLAGKQEPRSFVPHDSSIYIT